MSGRLRFEAWTLPTAGTFEKITDIPALSGSSGTRELSAYSDSSIHVPADWDGLDLIISTTTGSLIRVYDGTTLVDEFLAERSDQPVDRPSVITISGTQINGIVEKLAVYPYNYPNDIPTAQDWVWGGPSILPALALADLNNIREEWELWHDGTGGSFTLTVDGQTTAAIDYTIVSPLVIENRLQSLSTVTDVTVAGDGSTEDTPWVITFHNPPNPGTFTITDSLTGGTATLTQITAGALDPSPITYSQRADARFDPDLHGTYADPPVEVVETLLNTGSDWALLVNATGQFAGSQIILSVKPGHTYSNVSVPVRPDSNGSYRLVIRDIYENLITASNPFEVPLTAGSYQTLTTPQFTVPDGVYQIVMRVAVVAATYADFRVDWQHATINEGDAEATPGEIVRILVENGQDERSAFTFLDIAGFTDTVDTDATSWPSSISFTASFGQHFGHVLDGLAGLGYEWQITPKGTPSGGFTHNLDLYVPGGAGTDLTASTGGPAVMSGTVSAANVVKRIPAYTAGVAWGNNTYLEDTDATRLTNFGRWERVFDVEHLSSTASLQELLDEQFAEQATNSTATQATVTGDDPTVPMIDYDIGDKIWWQFPGVLAKEARRIRRLSWTHQNLASYTLHASTVHTDESAMAAAVNKLLNKYERRRGTTTPTPYVPGLGLGVPVIVAGADTPDSIKKVAHFVCDGTNDKTQIYAANNLAYTSKVMEIWLVGDFTIPMSASFPAGIYLDSGVSLRGMGGGMGAQNTITVTGESVGEVVVDMHGPGSTVSDLYISKSGTPTVDMTVIATGTSDGQTVRNVSIVGFDGTGVLVSGDEFVIDHVLVNGTSVNLDYGISVDGPTQGIVDDCFVRACDVAGVNLSGCEGVRVKDLHGDSNVVDVLVPSSGASDLTIGPVYAASTSSWVVDVNNAARVTVLGGHLDSPTNGIRFQGGATSGIITGVSMVGSSSTTGIEGTGTGTTLLVDSNAIKSFTTGILASSSATVQLGDNLFESNTTDTSTSGGGSFTTHVHTNAAGITFTATGTLTVSSGTLRFPITSAMTITNIRAMCNTAPTGASAIFDVNLNGTTVFTTQGNRPTIAVSTTDSGNTVPDVTALAAGDYLQIDVDQVGSTVAGADAVLVIEVQA